LHEKLAMKSWTGNFFEDFRVGQQIAHAPSRALTEGDAAVYKAIYGSRFDHGGLDDLLVFHTVFGMSVNDISLNAVANLGYAEGLFRRPVVPGMVLHAHSEVIGLKQNSDAKTGIVYVRTRGFDDEGKEVLGYARWVMVRKRDAAAPAPAPVIPKLAAQVAPGALVAGSAAPVGDHMWDDYAVGEKIDHIDGTTIEEAEHALATRLYHNTARVHFNLFTEKDGRFGKRLVYGGHVISIARALSFNGLENAGRIAAINGGKHSNPVFAGDTIFAWSEVLDKAGLSSARDQGALRLRLVATKNLPCAAFPDAGSEWGENVVLDFDYWAILPRR
jgi:2-methylfumaryl-CoA hydratase